MWYRKTAAQGYTGALEFVAELEAGRPPARMGPARCANCGAMVANGGGALNPCTRLKGCGLLRKGMPTTLLTRAAHAHPPHPAEMVFECQLGQWKVPVGRRNSFLHGKWEGQGVSATTGAGATDLNLNYHTSHELKISAGRSW